jgi:hypothetical protein
MNEAYVRALEAHNNQHCYVLVTESEAVAHATNWRRKWHGLLPIIVADGQCTMADIDPYDEPAITRHRWIFIGSVKPWVYDGGETTPPVVRWACQSVNELATAVLLYRMQLTTQASLFVKSKERDLKSKDTIVARMKAIAAEPDTIMRSLVAPTITISVAIGQAVVLCSIDHKHLVAACQKHHKFIVLEGPLPTLENHASHAEVLCVAAVTACVSTIVRVYRDHQMWRRTCARPASAAAAAAAAAAPNNPHENA